MSVISPSVISTSLTVASTLYCSSMVASTVSVSPVGVPSVSGTVTVSSEVTVSPSTVAPSSTGTITVTDCSGTAGAGAGVVVVSAPEASVVTTSTVVLVSAATVSSITTTSFHLRRYSAHSSSVMPSGRTGTSAYARTGTHSTTMHSTRASASSRDTYFLIIIARSFSCSGKIWNGSPHIISIFHICEKSIGNCCVEIILSTDSPVMAVIAPPRRA